jgi:hypothetical protein
MAPEAGRDLLESVEQLRRKEGFPMVMREGRIVDDTWETERMLDADWLARRYVNGEDA